MQAAKVGQEIACEKAFEEITSLVFDRGQRQNLVPCRLARERLSVLSKTTRIGLLTILSRPYENRVGRRRIALCERSISCQTDFIRSVL
jgi:hypothetical protein